MVKTISGFGLDILAYDISHDIEFSNHYKLKYCDLRTLMSESDIISIHCSLTPSTHKFINKEQLDLMKPNAILINTSRGEILDEEYLFEILKNKKIAGAGLDVFINEPYNGPLVELDNVVMTPHIASYAKELRLKMEREAVDNILKGLNG